MISPESAEQIRHYLYPFGLIASFFFTFRFIVQWLASERTKQSCVPKLFWHLSIGGNILLMFHSLVQLQFPMYLLQSQHTVLSWRNLNLRRSKPKKFIRVVFTLIVVALSATFFFIYHQRLISSESITWMRSPVLKKEVPTWLHIIGCTGLIAFSARFWLQWWQAERSGISTIPKNFWIISLIGNTLTFFYFALLLDWVNLIGPLTAFVPYIRNLSFYKKQKKSDCIIIAGETSGDLIGKRIVEELPSWHFSGVAGPEMRKCGVSAWFYTESFQVMGIIDVIKRLPFLIYATYSLVRRILKEKPKVVICIDQPSFSLGLAKRLKKRRFKGKIIQIVAPTVWAYRPERAKYFAQYFDHIMPLFRFETEYFSHLLPTTWIGHPTLQSIVSTTSPKTKLALFPGSRPGEISRNLRVQLEAAHLLQKKYPKLTIAISISQSLTSETKKKIERYAQLLDSVEFVDFNDRYELMNSAQAAIAKLGTVTLELALHHVPCVCCYKVNGFTEWWVKHFLRLKTQVATHRFVGSSIADQSGSDLASPREPPLASSRSEPSQSPIESQQIDRWQLEFKPRQFALPNILTGQTVFPECILPPVCAQDLVDAIDPYICGIKRLPDDLQERLHKEIVSDANIAKTILETVHE